MSRDNGSMRRECSSVACTQGLSTSYSGRKDSTQRSSRRWESAYRWRIAFRQHAGGHSTGPNWSTWISWPHGIGKIALSRTIVSTLFRYCTATDARLTCGYGICDVITMSNVTVPATLGVVYVTARVTSVSFASDVASKV